MWRAAEEPGFPYGAIVRLLILTGYRREEIGALRREEVKHLDGPEPRIELGGARTKTGVGRTVPLWGPAADILRGLPTPPARRPAHEGWAVIDGRRAAHCPRRHACASV